MNMLGHVRITELSAHLAVKVCSRALADLGAVVDVYDDTQTSAADAATVVAALDLFKQNHAGDPTKKQIFVSYGKPAAVAGTAGDPFELRRTHPDAVVVHISPFGLRGPRADEPACDLTLFASSGIAHLLTGQTDNPNDDPPQRAVGEQSAFISGLAAACAAAGALGADGGALIDVAMHEALATLATTELTRAAGTGKARTRVRVGDGNGATVCILPCSDGYVAISPREQRQWQAWLGVMGNPAFGDEPRFATKTCRERNWDELYALLCTWSEAHTREAIATQAQAARVPAFPLRRLEESLASSQLAMRGFFRPQTLGDKRIKLPGRPYIVTTAAGGSEALPAPASPRLPLAGIRVLDFSWVIAGPTTTRYLAALGADVIKVEAPGPGDPGRGSELHSVLGQGKRAIVLDLKHPEGQCVARELASHSHVVLENFATGVMERFGLGAGTLQQDNPGLVYVSASGMGRAGPEANAVAYGTLLQCYSGFAELNGTPGQTPRVGMAWLDPMCGLMLAMLCCAAVEARREGLAGARIDFSMIEAMLWTMLEPLLAVQRGAAVSAVGNAGPDSAHDIWRARGDDRWIALGATTQSHWRALCRRVPALTALSELSAEARAKAPQSWRPALAAWCLESTPEAIVASLAGSGIPVAPVVDARALVDDTHLAERAFWDMVGQQKLPGLPWQSDLERKTGAAPALGAHTDEVLTTLLGFTDARIDALRAAGVLG